jgi:hypothetical protein
LHGSSTNIVLSNCKSLQVAAEKAHHASPSVGASTSKSDGTLSPRPVTDADALSNLQGVAVDDQPTAVQPGKLVKKKIIKKIVRRVPAGPSTATGVVASHQESAAAAADAAAELADQQLAAAAPAAGAGTAGSDGVAAIAVGETAQSIAASAAVNTHFLAHANKSLPGTASTSQVVQCEVDAGTAAVDCSSQDGTSPEPSAHDGKATDSDGGHEQLRSSAQHAGSGMQQREQQSLFPGQLEHQEQQQQQQPPQQQPEQLPPTKEQHLSQQHLKQPSVSQPQQQLQPGHLQQQCAATSARMGPDAVQQTDEQLVLQLDKRQPKQQLDHESLEQGVTDAAPLQTGELHQQDQQQLAVLDALVQPPHLAALPQVQQQEQQEQPLTDQAASASVSLLQQADQDAHRQQQQQRGQQQQQVQHKQQQQLDQQELAGHQPVFPQHQEQSLQDTAAEHPTDLVGKQQQQQQQLQQAADSIGAEQLSCQQCPDLQHQLTIREHQMQRQADRLSQLEAAAGEAAEMQQQLQAVVAALTAKNEQLVLRASRVSEGELEEVRREAAERLAAAERKVGVMTLCLRVRDSCHWPSDCSVQIVSPCNQSTLPAFELPRRNAGHAAQPCCSALARCLATGGRAATSS